MKQNTKRKIENLYRYAEKNGIIINENCPSEIIGMAMILPKSKRKCISITPSDEAAAPYTRLKIFAHEIGHCMTNTFWYEGADEEWSAYCERLADLWAIYFIVSVSELEQARRKGYKTIEELATYFGVSVAFMEKAIDAHLCGYLQDFLEYYGEALHGKREGEQL